MRNARWVIAMSFVVLIATGRPLFGKENEKAILPTTLRIEQAETDGGDPRIFANTSKGVELVLFAPKDMKVGGLEVDGALCRRLERHKHGEYRPTAEDIANWRVLGNFVKPTPVWLSWVPFVGGGTWAQLPGRVPRGLNGVVVVPTEGGKALLFMDLVSDKEMRVALKTHYAALGVNMSKVPDELGGAVPDATPPAVATPTPAPEPPAAAAEGVSYN